ncbi:uncharacterized protein [Salvelinus sp. IW2-2015]|uniref:uncharacterized protein n=1 Tax=Salvelinus sp. IW2-2015 TaxID=2691554 RepID=UPI0038D37F8C
MAHLPTAVVIDNGTDQMRVGNSGSTEPSLICKNVTGRSESNSSEGELCFGDEAWGRRDDLSVIRPMKRGRVVSWADMEAIWSYVFNMHVKTPSCESPVLLTEFPLTTQSDRENTCRMMFEGLGVPALYLAPQSLLALLSSGRVTGCVVDCGYDVTHAVPVFEGHCLPHAVRQLGLGGQDVTAHLALLLKESGAQFSSTTQEHDTVTIIKEQMCYVSTDPSSETATTIIGSADADYQLPDGQMLRIGSERFGAPEILFSPQTVRMVTQGIPSLLVSSVLESDADLWQLLLDNAVLAGGSSLLPGMGHRLREEASALAPQGDRVGPVPVMDTAWLGGSLLSSLSIFGDMCISALEYQEMGSNVIHHKCF